MPWLLGCLPPREPHLLDYYFTVLGKALYVANAFEFRCRGLLDVVRFANACRDTGEFDAAAQLMATMKSKMLAGTVAELGIAMPVQSRDLEVLERAKDARNFIAHEGGNIGSMMDADEKRIREQLDLIRAHVKLLAEGDNVASRWEYEICEKEPAPVGICEFYPGKLEDWIFGGEVIFDGVWLYYQRYVEDKSG